MDCPSGYNSALVSASKNLSKGVEHTVVSTLAFDSPGVSGLYFSKGSKRKCSAIDQHINLKDGSSLVLGLGGSSSSSTTVCSGKEIEEESSIDLSLSINPNKASAVMLDKHKIKRPVLDLQLSLSTGPTESDVTTVSQGFIPCHKYSESPALTSTVEILDEGSTSSRWKTGPRVPPLQNVQTVIPFEQNNGHSNPDPVTSNISSTVVGTPTPGLVGSSSGPNNQQKQHKSSVKTCNFEGCTKGARGASGLCIAHGGGRRCQRAGCQKGAEGKTVFCKAHGGGRRCQHLGCTKSAEGRTDYCIGHGGGRRCSHEGCPRAARGKSGLCIRHGGGKRCMIENCTKSAEGITGLCISHGGGRRCQYPECTKGAQGSTMFCKAHGGGRRCTSLGCMKGAEGSTPFCKGHGGGKRCTSKGCTKSVHGGTLFCVSHGGGKRCAMPECTKSARGRTNYCVRHGGGKRCKYEGCTKSAQGSTDFCKAHGGGKRCNWAQLGLEFGSQDAVQCDKFARGKSGLCAAHSAQAQEKQTHRSFETFSTTQDGESSMSTQMTTTNECGTSNGPIVHGHQPILTPISLPDNFFLGNSCFNHLSLPEGRVHGGSLMAMLGGGEAMFRTNNDNHNQEGHSHAETGKSNHMPHSWV